MSLPHIEGYFPALAAAGYQKTSDEDLAYNCIAWAAGDVTQKWWPGQPGYYWPPQLPGDNTLQNFVTAYGLQGYRPCDSDQLQRGYEKVAIYVDSSTAEPLHAARQLPDGRWTSKLGDYEDITHNSLAALEGATYGGVRQILRRQIGPRNFFEALTWQLRRWASRLSSRSA